MPLQTPTDAVYAMDEGYEICTELTIIDARASKEDADRDFGPVRPLVSSSTRKEEDAYIQGASVIAIVLNTDEARPTSVVVLHKRVRIQSCIRYKWFTAPPFLHVRVVGVIWCAIRPSRAAK